MASTDANPTQAWLGNIPLEFSKEHVVRELEGLGYATPVDVKVISKQGHKTSFAIVTFANKVDADFVKAHGLSWSNGKYAVVRTIPLYIVSSNWLRVKWSTCVSNRYGCSRFSSFVCTCLKLESEH